VAFYVNLSKMTHAARGGGADARAGREQREREHIRPVDKTSHCSLLAELVRTTAGWLLFFAYTPESKVESPSERGLGMRGSTIANAAGSQLRLQPAWTRPDFPQTNQQESLCGSRGWRRGRSSVRSKHRRRMCIQQYFHTTNRLFVFELAWFREKMYRKVVRGHT